jgi:hypothetical protein
VVKKGSPTHPLLLFFCPFESAVLCGGSRLFAFVGWLLVVGGSRE